MRKLYHLCTAPHCFLKSKELFNIIQSHDMQFNSRFDSAVLFNPYKIDAGTSLVVRWLRFCAPSAKGSDLIPGQGAISHIPQLRVHMLQRKDPACCSQNPGCPNKLYICVCVYIYIMCVCVCVCVYIFDASAQKLQLQTYTSKTKWRGWRLQQGLTL